MKRAIHFLLTLSCAVALCASASAQVQTTSAITGTVADGSGAVMPGVNVTVRNGDTGAVRETLTNDTGHYSVQALRPENTQSQPLCRIQNSRGQGSRSTGFNTCRCQLRA